MKWFKSVWLKLRKSNGLPGNEVLIPLEVKQEVIQEKPKRKYTRKKKDVIH